MYLSFLLRTWILFLTTAQGLLMAVCGLKGMGCLFKRTLSCLDCTFSFKMFIHLLFSPLSFALYCSASFFRRGGRLQRAHTHPPYSWSCPAGCRAGHVTIQLHGAAEGGLPHSCPTWRPVCVCSHLPSESSFFTSVLRNNCRPLLQRSR